MASTRNRNTPGNYSLEQREYKQFTSTNSLEQIII